MIVDWLERAVRVGQARDLGCRQALQGCSTPVTLVGSLVGRTLGAATSAIV